MERTRPCAGGRFLVSIGDRDGHDAASGFAGVVFPPFEIARDHHSEHAPERLPSAAAPLLLLRRGVTGSLDLYEWWDEARREPSPPTRTVTVTLLADDHRTPVMTWRFVRACPVSLTYSPLNALEPSVVMEEVALAFERVEIG